MNTSDTIPVDVQITPTEPLATVEVKEDAKEDVKEDVNEDVKDVAVAVGEEEGCARRGIGCFQCLAGCIGCPLVSAASLVAGVFLTVKACLCLKCMSDDFLREREMVCTCFGVGTGCAVSTLLVLAGYSNLMMEPPLKHRQALVYMSDMTR